MEEVRLTRKDFKKYGFKETKYPLDITEYTKKVRFIKFSSGLLSHKDEISEIKVRIIN